MTTDLGLLRGALLVLALHLLYVCHIAWSKHVLVGVWVTDAVPQLDVSRSGACLPTRYGVVSGVGSSMRRMRSNNTEWAHMQHQELSWRRWLDESFLKSVVQGEKTEDESTR
jgi:hypothetical protein